MTSGKEINSDYVKKGEELLAAVRSKDLDRVQQALDDGADINYMSVKGDPNYDVALHQAIENQSEDIVTLLLLRGANPNQTTIYTSSTPLEVAKNRASTSEKGKKILDRLIEAGARSYTPLEKTILAKSYVEEACVKALERGEEEVVVRYIELTQSANYKLDLYKSLTDRAIEQKSSKVLEAMAKKLSYNFDEFLVYNSLLERALNVDTNLGMKIADAAPHLSEILKHQEESPLFGVDFNGPNMQPQKHYSAIVSPAWNSMIDATKTIEVNPRNIALDTANIALAGVVAKQILSTSIGRKVAASAREAVDAISGLWADSGKEAQKTTSKRKEDKKSPGR